MGRVLHGEGDALGGVDDHRVGESQVELQLLGALGDDTVANALDLKLLLIALGDTDDHVLDEGARQTVQRAVLPLVVGTGDDDLSLVVLVDCDGLGDAEVQGTLGALHLDVLAIQLHLNTGRDGDGEPANTRHFLLLTVSTGHHT